MNYSDKLKDPRWQKLRLKVMEHDGFKCFYCDDDKGTLNVHHYEYKTGVEPWEYEPWALVTLCETCHKLLHSENPRAWMLKCIQTVIKDANGLEALEFGKKVLEIQSTWKSKRTERLTNWKRVERDR